MSWFTKQMRDARWYVFLNNAILLVAGMWWPGLQRDLTQIWFCFATGIATEITCAGIFKKHGKLRLWDRAFSASIACVSTLILIRSSDWWFYGFIASVAVLSKYILVNANRQHFFNPTNFAIVFALAFMPDHLFVRPDQFSNEVVTYFVLLPMVFAFGIFAMIFARRWRGTLAYYITVLGIGFPVGHFILGIKSLWILAPELNTSTLIFAFLMMTDPKTSPYNTRLQWVFGVTIALLHLVLRYEQVPYSPFVALFVVTGIFSLPRKIATQVEIIENPARLAV